MYSPPSDLQPETRISFVKAFAMGIRDTTQSNYDLVFEAEQRRQNPRLEEDHINLNSFIARLLSAIRGPGEPKEVVTSVDEGLFILSTTLEGHESLRYLLDVDIPAAAQYMIHASGFMFGKCEKGTGRDLATTDPAWATQGKMWTGPPGLSRQRWDFWESRFEELAGSDNITEATRKIAATAAQAMALITAFEL